jgi:hypothetical protein
MDKIETFKDNIGGNIKTESNAKTLTRQHSERVISQPNLSSPLIFFKPPKIPKPN